MATFGALVNLPEDDPEAARRKSFLESVLVGHQPKYAYGAAQYGEYSLLADKLANTGSLPDIFLATCWPGLDALRNATGQGIVFTGLTEPSVSTYDTRITGIKAFAVTKLCRNWLALLRQITPTITRVAVICDQDRSHENMRAQFAEIDKFKSPLSSLEIIHAEDPNGNQPVNPHIERDIASFAQDNTPAGLIVTAGTRTLLLRDNIIRAVNAANSATPKLFTIYPTTAYVDSGGLMSYGPDLSRLYRAAAHFLGLMIELNIRPEDFQYTIPIIENQNFELVISQRAANHLSINIPTMFTVTIDSRSQQIKPTIVT
jgi:putative ABC transport system substrate-binding protein